MPAAQGEEADVAQIQVAEIRRLQELVLEGAYLEEGRMKSQKKISNALRDVLRRRFMSEIAAIDDDAVKELRQNLQCGDWYPETKEEAMIRANAVASTEGGAFLHASPGVSHLQLSNEAFMIAVRRRLGLHVVVKEQGREMGTLEGAQLQQQQTVCALRGACHVTTVPNTLHGEQCQQLRLPDNTRVHNRVVGAVVAFLRSHSIPFDKESSAPFINHPDPDKRNQRIEIVLRRSSFTAPPFRLPNGALNDRELHTVRYADPRSRINIHTNTTDRMLAIDATIASVYSGVARLPGADGASSVTVGGFAAAKVVTNKGHYIDDMDPAYTLRTAAFESYGMPGRMTKHVVELLVEEVVRRKGIRKGYVLSDIWQRLSVALQKGYSDRISRWSVLNGVPDVSALAIRFSTGPRGLVA
jgi:hypothetical protein